SFGPAGSLAGTILGGGMFDTLDYSAYGAPVTINLAAKKATGTGGINTVEQAIGSAGGQDALIGPNLTNSWDVSAANQGALLGFSGDTLKAIFAFIGFEDLTGGALDDTFTLEGLASISGHLLGGGGQDTLDYHSYAAPVTVNLQVQTATGTGGIADLDVLVGSPFNDKLIGPNLTNYWDLGDTDQGGVTAIALDDTTAFQGTLLFSAVEALTGGTAADTFALHGQAAASAKVNGGGGLDTLSYDGYANPATVSLQALAATGTGGIADIDVLVGSTFGSTLI